MKNSELHDDSPATGYIITRQNLQPEPLLSRPSLGVDHFLAPCQLCDYQDGGGHIRSFFPTTLAVSFCQAPHLGRSCLLWHSVLGGSSLPYVLEMMGGLID